MPYLLFTSEIAVSPRECSFSLLFTSGTREDLTASDLVGLSGEGAVEPLDPLLPPATSAKMDCGY
jgi:hypothetical protein